MNTIEISPRGDICMWLPTRNFRVHEQKRTPDLLHREKKVSEGGHDGGHSGCVSWGGGGRGERWAEVSSDKDSNGMGLPSSKNPVTRPNYQRFPVQKSRTTSALRSFS